MSHGPPKRTTSEYFKARMIDQVPAELTSAQAYQQVEEPSKKSCRQPISEVRPMKGRVTTTSSRRIGTQTSLSALRRDKVVVEMAVNVIAFFTASMLTARESLSAPVAPLHLKGRSCISQSGDRQRALDWQRCRSTSGCPS